MVLRPIVPGRAVWPVCAASLGIVPRVVPITTAEADPRHPFYLGSRDWDPASEKKSG